MVERHTHLDSRDLSRIRLADCLLLCPTTKNEAVEHKIGNCDWGKILKHSLPHHRWGS